MERYYYAGGKRVLLTVDIDRVGVDGERAAKAGLSAEVSHAKKAGTRMPGGVFLVPRSELTRSQLTRLRKAGAALTVYRVGKTVALPMPEVRVELGASDRGATLAAARDAGVAAEFEETPSGRLVLRPRSGSGEDALSLANFIYEHAHPQASSPRMAQVMPSPAVRRRGAA